jgi:hypothetical protein
MKTRIKLAHIINPVKVVPGSDLYAAQPVTFETIQEAKNKAAQEMDITLYTVSYPEDEDIIPGFFKKLPALNRTVHDFGRFDNTKKLPLLKDILDRLYQHSQAEFFIYSNVDIALMPEFYLEIGKIIESGYDAFAVNRCTINDTYTRIEDIPRTREEVMQNSEPHPGFDCFIFRRSAYSNYILGTACVGGNWIGRVLLGNMMAFAGRFLVFEDKKMTFHLGDERCWNKPRHNPFNRHNEEQMIEILEVLLNRDGVKHKEQLKNFFPIHFKQPSLRLSDLPKIIQMNSISLKLPAAPDELYHSRFRNSLSWIKYQEQKLKQDPVFIVGYPRSGTTLVQGLLVTQNNTASFPETHFFSLVRRILRVNNDRIQPGCLSAVIDKIRERTALSRQAESHLHKIAKKPGLSVKMLFENIVIDNLLSRVGYPQLRTVKWVEKTPDHVNQLDVIFRFYPQAKIIYVMRNPEKAIFSRRRHFVFNQEARWPLEQHVRLWLDGIKQIEKFKQNKPENVLIVKLEAIAAQTEEEMRKICAFAGLDFDAGRLARYKEISETLVHPWESWKNGAGKDISSELALRPMHCLSEDEKTMLVGMAYPELKRYGYLNELDAEKKKIYRRNRRMERKKESSLYLMRKSVQNHVLPLFKKYSGKINLAEQLELFYGKHRSGWSYAVQSLSHLHNPRGVYMDAFIERTFAWKTQKIEPHFRPWIGFIHVPPKVPDWFQSSQSNKSIFSSPVWEKSVPFCRGLFTLSRYHREYLEKKLDIPVENLYFPTETPELKWKWDRFHSNPEKKIVQVGWWLRRIHSIFRLPEGAYRKIFLKVDHFNWDHLIHKEYVILNKKGLFSADMYNTADVVGFLPDDEYDKLLAENIIFLHLYDSSANNTIIECIVRNTPLLVNPLPAVKEYLGKDYPFYFNTLEEAAEKAADQELIHAAHTYLVNHPFKSRFTGEYFAEHFHASEIYRKL